MRKPPYYICVLFAVAAIYGAAIEEAWISALMAVFASALLAYAFYVVEEITK